MPTRIISASALLVVLVLSAVFLSRRPAPPAPAAPAPWKIVRSPLLDFTVECPAGLEVEISSRQVLCVHGSTPLFTVDRASTAAASARQAFEDARTRGFSGGDIVTQEDRIVSGRPAVIFYDSGTLQKGMLVVRDGRSYELRSRRSDDDTERFFASFAFTNP